MHPAVAILLLTTFASLAIAPAPLRANPPAWTLSAQSQPVIAGPHLSYLKKTLRSTGSNPRSSTLHLVLFNTTDFTLKIVDQGDSKPGRFRDLPDAMRHHFCVAGCNGGFFHPDFRPCGLVIADGNRIHSFEQAKLLSGLVTVDKKGPHLVRRGEFRDHAGIVQLLQSGPFLVDRGRAVTGLSASPDRNRTFIATDGKNQWAIGLATTISLAGLGAVLADPAVSTGFQVERALNLDGGSSSALYFDLGAGLKPFHKRGFATVRNFLGVAPH